jgi:two-component system CheB/CheR fusion protein
MVVLDADLRLKTANKAFCQIFCLTSAELTGQSIFQIKNSQWNFRKLCTLLIDLLDCDRAFEDFAATGYFPDVGKLTLLINARRIVNLHDNTELILMAFETIASQSGSRCKAQRMSS